MVRLDAANEKIEAEDRGMSVKINQVVVVDLVLSPLPKPDANLQAKTLPRSKPPYLEDEKNNVELNNHRHGMPRPPSKLPELPDTDPLAVIFPQPVPRPKPPDWDVSEEEGGLRAGFSPSKPPGRREFPPSSPNQPTWYPSISPTATEPFNPGDVASVIGHVRVTGAATTTKFGSGLSSPQPPATRTNLMEKKDELRVKWEIGELGNILYLMGQIDKSLPSILHNIIWLHVCPLYQHTFPFIAHESLNGHPLSLVICHAYLMQWEEVIWAGIELLGFNNNWAIRKGEWNLKLRRKDYFAVPHYDQMFSSREQLSKTIAEDISLLFKLMTMSIYQFQYGQRVDEHSGKEKCVSIFIPNHYVGTLKELSKDVVSIRVGNSSNLIRIG
jgi:hypothetical protein